MRRTTAQLVTLAKYNSLIAGRTTKRRYLYAAVVWGVTVVALVPILVIASGLTPFEFSLKERLYLHQLLFLLVLVLMNMFYWSRIGADAFIKPYHLMSYQIPPLKRFILTLATGLIEPRVAPYIAVAIFLSLSAIPLGLASSVTSLAGCVLYFLILELIATHIQFLSPRVMPEYQKHSALFAFLPFLITFTLLPLKKLHMLFEVPNPITWVGDATTLAMVGRQSEALQDLVLLGLFAAGLFFLSKLTAQQANDLPAALE